MKFVSRIALFICMILTAPVASAAFDAETQQIAENRSMHPDFIMTIDASLNGSGKIYTVKDASGKILLSVYAGISGTEILFPEDAGNRSNKSGPVPSWLEIPQTEIIPLGDVVSTEQIAGDDNIAIYAVYNNGSLVGFLIVNLQDGTATYTPVDG